MLIAITATAPSWDAPIDERFGRARGFILVEHDARIDSLTWVANKQNLQAAQGAGVQAAELVFKHHADAVITGHVGPKAYRALQAAGVQIYLGSKGTAREALDALRAGQLEAAAGADVEAHW